MKRKKTLSYFVFTALGLSACALGMQLPAETPPLGDPEIPYVVVDPFETMTLTSDQSLIQKMVLQPTGNAPFDYGLDEGNPGLRGRFRFDGVNKSIIFERSVASGSAWRDMTLWPPHPLNLFSFRLGRVREIEVKIRSVINGVSIASQCGIALGFGDTNNGHPHAELAGTNLRMAQRDWDLSSNSVKRPRDYMRFSYHFRTTEERIAIDAPINSHNQATEWTKFGAAEWREIDGDLDLIKESGAIQLGDFFVYRLKLQFADDGKVAIEVTPLESNLPLADQSVEVVWDMLADLDEVDPVSLMLRNGLDLTNISKPEALSYDELLAEIIHLGFVGNQASRACEFSELKVSLLPESAF